MRVFIVVATRGSDAILRQIRSHNFPHYAVRNDAWLVASDSTTRELAESLEIRSGTAGAGLVCSIETYSGRLPKDVWEWLSLHEAKGE